MNVTPSLVDKRQPVSSIQLSINAYNMACIQHKQKDPQVPLSTLYWIGESS